MLIIITNNLKSKLSALDADQIGITESLSGTINNKHGLFNL